VRHQAFIPAPHQHLNRRNMAEILLKWRKTKINQSINQSINLNLYEGETSNVLCNYMPKVA
jgi:hypothetical protein